LTIRFKIDWPIPSNSHTDIHGYKVVGLQSCRSCVCMSVCIGD